MSDAEHLPLPEPLYRCIDQAGHTYAAGPGGPCICGAHQIRCEG